MHQPLRTALAGLVSCSLVLAVLGGSTCDARAEGAEATLEMKQVAPGVFVHGGRHEDANEVNHGDIANIGFVVGSRCVAVIDTGGSLRIGQQLRAAIHKSTSLPVCFVINTHMHPDHVLGNAAFLEDKPHFVGHAHLSAALNARRSSYQLQAQRLLGTQEQGFSLVLPDLAVNDTMSLELGDRTLSLRAWPTAHTDNDLTVLDTASGTLWLGDLLFLERIPVIDGSIRGWLDVLQQLRTVQPVHVVPGHGSVDAQWPASLDREAHYLDQLATEMRAAIRAGRSLGDTIDHLDQSMRNDWLLFDNYHMRNATAAFAELEWE
jgi:quinoprotein relay system zinc metallohydrolase 2